MSITTEVLERKPEEGLFWSPELPERCEVAAPLPRNSAELSTKALLLMMLQFTLGGALAHKLLQII